MRNSVIGGPPDSNLFSLYSLAFCTLFHLFLSFGFSFSIEQDKVDIHPVSKMMMGLTFYELWYSSIPEEFQWRNSDQFDLQENSNMEETSFTNKTGQSERYNSVESHVVDSHCPRDSDASIMNDKHISRDVVFSEDIEVGTNKREKLQQNFQPEGFYLNSEEQKGFGDPFSNNGGLTQDILYGLGRYSFTEQVKYLFSVDVHLSENVYVLI